MTDTILLIDDDRSHNFISKAAIGLEYPYIECHIAKNGEEALNWLQNNIPLLIIVDLNLPSMDGFTFLDEYGKQGYDQRATSIIMLTSALCEEDYLRSKNYPVLSDCLSKPLDYRSLSKYFPTNGSKVK